MQIKHLEECSTTAGAVATVAQPFETVQKRTPEKKLKGSNLLKGIKTSGKYANSLHEGEQVEEGLKFNGGIPDVDHMHGAIMRGGEGMSKVCPHCNGNRYSWTNYEQGKTPNHPWINPNTATLKSKEIPCPACDGGRKKVPEGSEYDADLNDYRVKDAAFKKKHGVSKDEILDKKYFHKHKPGATPKATSNKQGHDPEHRGTMSGFVREAQGSLTESELKGIRSLGDIVDQRPKGKAVPAQQYKQVDMRDKPCLKCGKGTYGERTFYDDMDGVQRCDKCKHVTKRYIDVPVTEGAKVDRMMENKTTPNTDQILYALTDAARHIANSDAYGTDGKRTISALYDLMRTPLKAGDLAGFEKAYDYCLRKYPDEASELIDTMYQSAKLGDQGTYEEFMTKMHEGKKVDRMVGHVKSSEQKLGKSAKEAENIAWATANKRGMLDNKNKKKVAEGSLNESDKFTSWYDWKDQAKSSGYTITRKDDKIVALNKQGQVVGHWSDVGKFLSGKAPRPNFKRPVEQGVAEADDKKEWQKQNAKPKQLGKTEKYFSTRHTTKDTGAADKEQGVAEGSGGNWYIRVNGKILNDTKFKPMIFSSEDEARSYAMKLADKKRIPLSQIKLTKSWMDAPEQGVAEGSPQSMGTALANTLSKVEPGSKLDKKIRHHNDMVRRFGPEAGTMTSAPDGYRIDKKGFVRLGQGVAEGKDDKIAQLKKDYNTAVHWSQNERSPQKREAARRKAETIKAHLEKQYKQGVAEGRFVRGPHPVTGQIVDYDRQGNPKEPKVIAPKEPKVRGPRRDSNGLTRDDYQKVWRKIEEVVGNIFPDGDPIDWLAPWLKKSGIEDFHIGEVLDKASKLNGYKDIYAYYDHFKTDDYGYGELAEGEITEDDVVLAPGKGSRLKPGLLHKQEVSVGPIDTVKVDVPLLIRLLEYAREDAKTDMDLHDLAEKLIALGARGRTLTMKDYERLVPETPMDEEQAVLTKPEWLSKRKALQDLQMDPETSKQPMLKQELIKKIADLKRRAEEAGLSEDVDECDFENMYQQKVEEVSDPMVRNYLGKAVYDTLTGKKDRNPGIKRAMNRLSGTNKPLLPKSK